MHIYFVKPGFTDFVQPSCTYYVIMVDLSLHVFTCFVDMAKAFDRVNRGILFMKLANIGISGDILESIKALYADCRASINVNDDYTDFFSIMSGVKQGDVISPTLFSIFINDLVKGIKELNEGVDISPDLTVGILLFADDIVLLAPTELNLQSELDYLHSWCNKNMMDVNINKTKVVHFRKSNTDRTEFNFKLGNNDIEIRGNYKHLGVVLNEYLDFTETANVLSESAERAFSSLIVNLYNKMDLLYSSYTKVYESKIVPIMDYASGVWGAKCFPKSDTLHNRIIRFFLGVHKCTSNAVIQGDMGWIPPSVRRQFNCLQLWNRFLNMNENRLTRRIFQWDYSKCRNNWCYDVKRILKSIGWGNIFTTALTDPANSTVSVEAARDKLMLNFKAKWGNDVSSQSKLDIYRIVKHQFGVEDYVKMNMNKKLRSVLVQLRAGCLPIEIELGRYQNNPRQERICKQCSSETVENEIHFMFNCSKYTDIRLALQQNVDRECRHDSPDSDRINALFSSRNLLFKCANFIMDALKLRTS